MTKRWFAVALIAAPWLALGLFSCTAKAQTIDTRGNECRIVQDPGGHLYRPNPYQRCEAVRLDGPCASTCTQNVFDVRDRVCVTPRASLGFHQAFADVPGHRRIQLPNLFRYPPDVQAWLASRGGLPVQLMSINGKQAGYFLRRC